MTLTDSFADCSLIPQVAMPFMNIVHCEELTLVGDLLEQVEKTASPEEIDTRLAGWLAHTEAHFAREERLMEEYSFPPYPVHQMEHVQALQQLRAIQQHWLDTRDHAALASYIRRDWSAWLHQHISTMDFVTANFLSQFDIQVAL